MGTGTTLLIISGALIVAMVLIYNRLISQRNQHKNAFSQIDVQLQRRYELIPNLVETARAYLAHESETLMAVTEARNNAESHRREVSKQEAAGTAASGATDGGLLRALANAEHSVSGALGRMNMVMEAYPDLKADQQLSELRDEIASTENRVAFARQAFSDAVMRYNISCEQFPAVIIARLFAFREAALFEADNDDARESVTVSFSKAA